MNILLVTHIFPPAVDGGSRVIYKLGEYLLNQDHRIYCLTSDCSSTDSFVTPNSKSLHQNPDINIKTFRIPVYKNLRRFLKLINMFLPKSFLKDLFSVFQKGPIFKLIPLIKAYSYLKNQKIDLIISGPLPTTSIIYAKIFSKLLKTKLLINASFHQTDSDFYKKPLLSTLKSADLIWSLTNYEQRFFVDKLKINKNKIITVGNGVDKNFIINKNKIVFPKKFTILFIGSLSAHKGVDILIKSFSELLASNSPPEASLIIAGQKTLHFPIIKKQYDKLPPQIKKNISFLFNFPQSKLNKLIDQSSVLVLPSKQESFGLVLIETMARGKPIITSNIPSLQEMINKTNAGLSFDITKSKSLSAAIKKIIKEPDLAKNFGINGLDYVKNNYTWDTIGKKICQKLY